MELYGMFVFGVFVGMAISLIIYAIADLVEKEHNRRDARLKAEVRKEIIDYYETINDKRLNKTR